MMLFRSFLTQLRWHIGLLALLVLPCFSNAQTSLITPASFLNNLQNVDLIDHNGHAFVPEELVNHVVLFSFIYTSCTSVCPLQTHLLAQVLQDLPADVRDQVRFVSVSIDPVNDTPTQLQAFAKNLHADLAGWSFLTGNAEQIKALTQRLHLLDESDPNGANTPQLHRTSLWLVDKQGRMLQRYQGDPPDKDRLIRELGQVSRMARSTTQTL